MYQLVHIITFPFVTSFTQALHFLSQSLTQNMEFSTLNNKTTTQLAADDCRLWPTFKLASLLCSCSNIVVIPTCAHSVANCKLSAHLCNSISTIVLNSLQIETTLFLSLSLSITLTLMIGSE